MERLERRILLGTLAAELGHDLQGAVNLFRLTVERLEQGAELDGEDLASLREELERISRLNGRLRLLAKNELRRETVSVPALLEAVRENVRRTTGHEVELEERASNAVEGDAALLRLAVTELISNALDAKRGRAGVISTERGFGVWDDGEGFANPLSLALSWGFTSRAERGGMGLTLAHRILRAHGFRLELEQSDERTTLWVWTVPPAPRPLPDTGGGPRR